MKNINIEKMVIKAKKSSKSKLCGMFLIHNGVVRQTSKAKVRKNIKDERAVVGMQITIDDEKVKHYIDETLKLKGIYYVDVQIKKGKLVLGDDIMCVIIGGDIRPRCIKALNFLVSALKTKCITETELF